MKNLRYLSASELARQLAHKTGLAEQQVRAVLQAQAELAYKCSRQGLEIPGLGVLVTVDRPEREIRVNFGPDAGKPLTQPGKTVLRFYPAELAKAAVAGESPIPPDVCGLELFPNGELEVF